MIFREKFYKQKRNRLDGSIVVRISKIESYVVLVSFLLLISAIIILSVTKIELKTNLSLNFDDGTLLQVTDSTFHLMDHKGELYIPDVQKIYYYSRYEKNIRLNAKLIGFSNKNQICVVYSISLLSLIFRTIK